MKGPDFNGVISKLAPLGSYRNFNILDLAGSLLVIGSLFSPFNSLGKSLEALLSLTTCQDVRP